MTNWWLTSMSKTESPQTEIWSGVGDAAEDEFNAMDGLMHDRITHRVGLLCWLLGHGTRNWFSYGKIGRRIGRRTVGNACCSWRGRHCSNWSGWDSIWIIRRTNQCFDFISLNLQRFYYQIGRLQLTLVIFRTPFFNKAFLRLSAKYEARGFPNSIIGTQHIAIVSRINSTRLSCGYHWLR